MSTQDSLKLNARIQKWDSSQGGTAVQGKRTQAIVTQAKAEKSDSFDRVHQDVFEKNKMQRRPFQSNDPSLGRAKRKPGKQRHYIGFVNNMSISPEWNLRLRQYIQQQNETRKRVEEQQSRSIEAYYAQKLNTNVTLRKIVTQASRKGVKLVLPPDNPDLYHAAIQSINVVKSSGNRLNGLVVRSTPAAVDLILDGHAMAYVNETKTVYIDPGVVKEDSPKDYVLGLKTHKMARLQQGLEHELIHFLHQKKNPLNYARLSAAQFKPASQKLAAKVSDYAMTNPLEFVAETGQQMLHGKPLPPKVVAMYQTLEGPLIQPSQEESNRFSSVMMMNEEQERPDSFAQQCYQVKGSTGVSGEMG